MLPLPRVFQTKGLEASSLPYYATGGKILWNLSQPSRQCPIMTGRAFGGKDMMWVIFYATRSMLHQTLPLQMVLVKYVDGMITACVKHDKLVTTVAGADTSDLRASFRRTLSFAIPLPTLYRNYRHGAYSDLIFGVPLVDVETNEDDVPKVMKMCIEEVEKRGMDTNEIYSVS
ncbi:hypothetical protein H4582DRAFT_1901678 [Lactarius indigo]|nr:hypothetical protein H4582DRAFT_1901678 [Lactarius indigo]